jgi:hypothetical protein
MLRWSLLVLGLLLFIVGFALQFMSGTFIGLQLMIPGGVIVAAVLGERWRYHQRELSGEGGWQRTGECFEDPETGVIMEVLYNPRSGERRYKPKEEESHII